MKRSGSPSSRPSARTSSLNSSRSGSTSLHVHALGQAADIVVRLDGHRGPAREGDALDDVGIERALGEEGRRTLAVRGDLFGFRLEHLDEQSADGLAFYLRVGNAGELGEEKIGGVHMNQRDVVVVAEHFHDLVGLVQAHQAVIDEDAGELVADRLVDQHRGDGGIDAAGEAADHPLASDLVPDLADHLGAVGRHRPVGLQPDDPVHEVGKQFCAVRRVHHLGVEHGRIVAAALVGSDGEGRVLRRRDDVEALGQFGDAVAVAHPDGIALADFPEAVEERACRLDLDIGAAEFSRVAALDRAAELRGHRLLAVANAEDRHA